MFLQLRQTVPPAVLPVTVQLTRQAIRLDQLVDDNLLSLVYIPSATAIVEAYLNRALITRSLSLTVAHSYPPAQWPSVMIPLVYPLGVEFAYRASNRHMIELLRSPVQSIASVSYGTWGADDTALVEGTDYTYDLTTDPARIRIMSNSFYDQCSDHLDIEYTAGYGDTPASIPAPIIHAILLGVGAAYEHRGDNEAAVISAAQKSLLDPYRLVTLY